MVYSAWFKPLNLVKVGNDRKASVPFGMTEAVFSIISNIYRNAVGHPKFPVIFYPYRYLPTYHEVCRCPSDPCCLKRGWLCTSWYWENKLYTIMIAKCKQLLKYTSTYDNLNNHFISYYCLCIIVMFVHFAFSKYILSYVPSSFPSCLDSVRVFILVVSAMYVALPVLSSTHTS